ncbi:MAG: preprotein translocase subunit YajC [Treponema sp.]|nr:preprotein translocase subunit YajC [Treponema sp.]
MSFIPLLQQPATGSGQMVSLIPFIAIIAIFYFFIIRPQNKKQKETEKMINALKKGDKVVTIGGIHGVVSSTKEKTIVVKVDSNTSIEFNRTAIAAVVSDKTTEKVSKKAKKDDVKEETTTETTVEATSDTLSENK